MSATWHYRRPIFDEWRSHETATIDRVMYEPPVKLLRTEDVNLSRLIWPMRVLGNLYRWDGVRDKRYILYHLASEYVVHGERVEGARLLQKHVGHLQTFNTVCPEKETKMFFYHFLANVNSSSCSLFVIVRPSVCRLSVVCLSSVVCNVGAPYSGDWNFQQCFYAMWYLGHPWPLYKNFTEIVPGEPLRRGVKQKKGRRI